MADRPIFDVGAQRSGTTLLQAMLGTHPRIAAPPEMHFISRIVALGDFLGDLNDDANLRRVLHDALNPTVPLLVGCGFDEAMLFERACARPRTFAAVLDLVMSDFAERHGGKARWSEKTPNQSIGAVRFLFPEAQVVHIVRDPRDVIASARETPWEDRHVVRLAETWRHFTLGNIAAGRVAGPSRFFQLRYEDLTGDPEAAMRLVCAFLGEGFVPEMIEAPARRSFTIAQAAAP